MNTNIPNSGTMLPVPQDRMSGRRSSSIVSRTLLGRRASVYATGQHQDPAKVSELGPRYYNNRYTFLIAPFITLRNVGKF